MGTTTTTEEPEQHQCNVCPTRSNNGNATFDYCEGCPHIERKCPLCEEFKPQVGWWWGWDRVGMWSWLCADCRLPLPDAQDFTQREELWASHPALRELATTYSRFTYPTGGLDQELCYELATVLSQQALRAGYIAGPTLSRMATILRAGDGAIDLDVSDLDMLARWRVASALSKAMDSTYASQRIYTPLRDLQKAWQDWLIAQFPPIKPPPTQADEKARELAAVRRNKERRVS